MVATKMEELHERRSPHLSVHGPWRASGFFPVPKDWPPLILGKLENVGLGKEIHRSVIVSLLPCRPILIGTLSTVRRKRSSAASSIASDIHEDLPPARAAM